jgi:hypothetical protein
VPRWGQAGDFVILVRDVRVRIDWESIWGFSFPAFGAHAVDWHKPFISETGYRSFLIGHVGRHSKADELIGLHVPTAVYAAQAIEAYLDAPDEHAPRRKKGAAKPRGLVAITWTPTPDGGCEKTFDLSGGSTSQSVPSPKCAGPFAEVVEEQTRAIEDARAAAAADVPFTLTAPAAADDSFQLGLFTHTRKD